MNAIIPQSFGSQQLRLFRRAIRDAVPIEEAATLGDYSLATAKLIVADDLKNPPPPEAFELLYHPDAPADASSTKEASMAKDEEGSGEYQRPDAKKAFEIYDNQIDPKLVKMNTLKGDLSQPYDDIKEHAHFPRQVLNFIIKLENLDDDAKRDHFLLALHEGLKHRELRLPRDLVTMANGQADNDIVGSEDREDGELLVDADEDEADEDAGQLPLAADAGAETFTEASEAELAKQEGRTNKPRATRTARPATVSRINPPGAEARAH